MSQRLLPAAVVTCAACLFATEAYSQGTPAAAISAPAVSPVTTGLARGYSLKNRKLNAEAITAFKGVLKADPNNHAALTELGYLHVTLQDYNSAVKFLSAASAQDPGNMRLHMDLGYAYQSLKQPGLALEQFKIVAASPGEFQAAAQKALQVSNGYDALKSGDRAAARKAFEAAVAADPKDAAALKQLGFINNADGNASAAAANFEAARALEPGDYSIALQLGYTYTFLRQEEQARREFSAALASPDTKIRDLADASLQSTGGRSAFDVIVLHKNASDASGSQASTSVKTAPTQSAPSKDAPTANAGAKDVPAANAPAKDAPTASAPVVGSSL